MELEVLAGGQPLDDLDAFVHPLTALGERDPHQLEAFEKLSKKTHRKSKQRNTFIHGIWAASEEHPDGLLLIDAKEYHEEDRRYKFMRFEKLEDEKRYFDKLWERSRLKYEEKISAQRLTT